MYRCAYRFVQVCFKVYVPSLSGLLFLLMYTGEQSEEGQDLDGELLGVTRAS